MQGVEWQESGTRIKKQIGLFVMRGALEDYKLSRVVGSNYLVDKPMLVVDASAPAAVHVTKRLRLADASVSVALNVFDKKIYPLEDLFPVYI